MFGNPVSDEARKVCLAFLRRAEAAFFNYGLAREWLIEVAESVFYLVNSFQYRWGPKAAFND